MKTYNEPLTKTIDTYLHSRRTEGTRRAYGRDIRGFLDFTAWGRLSLCEFMGIPVPVVHQQIVSYLNAFAAWDEAGHVTNGNTVNRKRYALHSLFQYLYRVYGYAGAPLAGVPVYPVPDRSNKALLSEQEIRAITSHLSHRRTESEQAFRDYLIVLCLFHLALRRHELAKLRWDDMFPNPPHLRVRQKRGSQKYLPIPPKLLERLLEFREVSETSSPYIFRPTTNNRTGITDKPLSTNTICNIVIRAGKAVNPRMKISPHAFRASFISLARSHRLDDRETMNATGIKTASTLNHYDIRELLEANAINHFADWVE